MSKQTVKNGLEALAQAAVPEGVNLWPGVRARMRTRAAHTAAPLRNNVITIICETVPS